jgi:hypothetical protein
MFIALAIPCVEPRAWGRVSDFGSEMGAEGRCQVRSRAANLARRNWLTCAYAHKQT